MKKYIFRIFIIFISIMVVINITNICNASTLGDTLSGAQDFIQSGNGNVSINSNNLQETSNSLYNALLMISFIVVAIVGISLGIKFMMSGAEEKADVKKSLVTFFIGCVVVYGAFGIWKVLVTFLNTL